MNGLEISRAFYQTHEKQLFDSVRIKDKVAIGFVGSGSERFGFDDEISKDHDFEAGFSIFLPDEQSVSRRDEFLLERAYNKLPKEFMGIKRELLAPAGGSRNGPVRTSEFYMQKVGSPDGNLTKRQWLTLPQYALFEATDGEVFFDGYGEFSRIRNKLLNMPEDVRRKRIAGNLLIMAQSGQYNFSRCTLRGEKEAARLSATEFVKATLEVEFLLKGKYAPYYKWVFRALRTFDENSASRLSEILLGNDTEKNISETAKDVIEKLSEAHFTNANDTNLTKHAYSVNNGIDDEEIRNLNILVSV